jgi:hypothetical protein
MNTPSAAFTPYRKVVVALLGFLQFAVILHFMLMAPLALIASFLLRRLQRGIASPVVVRA